MKPVRDASAAAARRAVQVAVMLLACGLAVAPLAASLALSRATVQETIGITPTSLALRVADHSELRIGLAGTFYSPRTWGPLGVVATVKGPGEGATGAGDLAGYVSPQMRELYAGVFHDPQDAVAGYLELLRRALWHELVIAEIQLTAGSALAIGLVWALLRPLRRPVSRWLVAWMVLAAAFCSLAWGTAPRSDSPDSRGRFKLPSLAGTAAAGTTTNSPLLRLAVEDAVPHITKLVAREERRVVAYRATALAGLDAQASTMTGPRPGETAVLVQADMHCNSTMTMLQRRVVAMLRSRYGRDTPAVVAIAGDLTTNGTPAEKSCIVEQRAAAGSAPVAAVTGNHESQTSAEQMANAGMHVLDGETLELGGVTILGDGDPERTELFGPTSLRGAETETDVGARLFERAGRDRPELVVVHEGYAAAAFLGVPEARAFLEGRGSRTEPHADQIRDLPTGALIYGHWHRQVDPRVVWNSDGSWTLVMELNTAGGAIDQPTLGRFSTPWAPPQQPASFPVLFFDDESGLVTGYQRYEFAVDGEMRVGPRVEVGASSPRWTR